MRKERGKRLGNERNSLERVWVMVFYFQGRYFNPPAILGPPKKDTFLVWGPHLEVLKENSQHGALLVVLSGACSTKIKPA